jgi:hypothetical protein
MGIARKTAALALTTAMTALGSAATAQAGTFICVPPQAGVAVVSGGPNGTCDSVSTPVQLPTAAADQQKLISLLPYVQFKASGMGGKPTIVIKGANLQLLRSNPGIANDGTGNLQIGSGENDADPGTHSGVENLIVGHDNRWVGTANGNAIFGAFNEVNGPLNLLAGVAHTVNGYRNQLLGGTGRQVLGSTGAVFADGAPISQSHWAKYDATGKLTASSEPLEYSYGDGRYAILKFKGVDLAKCAVTVQSADGKRVDSTWQLWSGSYIYAYGMNAAGSDWVPATPYDIVATCDK